MECFEADHGLRDAFDKAVILFKDIVEVFDLSDINHVAGTCELLDRVDGLQSSQVGSAFINVPYLEFHLLRGPS